MLKKGWKQGAVAAALGLAVFAHAGGANAAAAYKAVDGDTFWTLSKRYGVQLEQLLNANPQIDPLNVYAGLTISIPAAEGKKAEAGAPAAAAKQAEAGAAAAKQAATAPAKADAPAAKQTEAPTVKAAKAFAAAAPKADASSVSVNGNSYNYSNVIQAKASVYTAAASENGGWGAVDYFGNPLKLGTVAVDPALIPLGSKLYITGYDHNGLPTGGMMATASDMGGAIKGDRIDIFVPQTKQEASSFGFQYVKVFVLDK